MTWLKYLGLDETFAMQNIDNIKNTNVAHTFKEKILCKEYFEVKIKLSYYK